MEDFKSLINYISNPTILVTAVLIIFPFVFPPTKWFYKINKRLHLDKLWTGKGLLLMTFITVAFFIFGLGDYNFRSIVLKPDNVPISGLILLLIFFTWLSMSQAYKNDELVEKGESVDEHYDAPNDKVLVWPDLVYVELISLILISAYMIIWSIGLPAPLEQPANPAESPNPAKAPWYFLGLQEMLVYFDPWYAGVVLPTFIIIGLMAIPYLDRDPNGSGYYSYKDRKLSMSLYLFGWLILWNVLIVIGTFLRGPNWGFFGPFEYWDSHRLEALTNVKKHSQAKIVRVLLMSYETNKYSLIIEDDGIGIAKSCFIGHDHEASGEHIGLSIMRDRAKKINGHLVIESEPGEGVRVILSFNEKD